MSNDNEGMKPKRKNKSYSVTFRSSDKETERYGQMYEKTPVINALPEIGTQVIVRHREEFLRNPNVKHWTCEANFRDVYGKPAVFTIESYTQGIENPMLTNNHVILVRTPHGNRITQSIPTIKIVSGSVELIPC